MRRRAALDKPDLATFHNAGAEGCTEDPTVPV